MKKNFRILIFAVIFIACKNQKQLTFCECLEIETQIQVESESGNNKKLNELNERKKEFCKKFQGISSEEFYEKIKKCK